jgi:hypothetical protein
MIQSLAKSDVCDNIRDFSRLKEAEGVLIATNHSDINYQKSVEWSILRMR